MGNRFFRNDKEYGAALKVSLTAIALSAIGGYFFKEGLHDLLDSRNYGKFIENVVPWASYAAGVIFFGGLGIDIGRKYVRLRSYQDREKVVEGNEYVRRSPVLGRNRDVSFHSMERKEPKKIVKPVVRAPFLP